VLGDVPLNNNPNAALGLPINLAKNPEIIISRQQYVISWNAKNRGVNWAAWKLTAADIGQGRSGRWEQDPLLVDYLKRYNTSPIDFPDYQGSCFDRGHVVPSGDRNKTPEINIPTFFLSNVLPQTGFLNRVIWNNLEIQERILVTPKRPELFIYSGPLYEENLGAIGPKKDIRVPSAFFKVILSKWVGSESGLQNSELPLAIIAPNIISTGEKPNANPERLCKEFSDNSLGDKSAPPDNWKQYLTTIAEVERRSGLDIPNINNTVPIQ
jgi:endonuclease G